MPKSTCVVSPTSLINDYQDLSKTGELINRTGSFGHTPKTQSICLGTETLSLNGRVPLPDIIFQANSLNLLHTVAEQTDTTPCSCSSQVLGQ